MISRPKFSIGAFVHRNGSSDYYRIVATQRGEVEHCLQKGFDYAIQKFHDSDGPVHQATVECVLEKDLSLACAPVGDLSFYCAN